MPNNILDTGDFMEQLLRHLVLCPVTIKKAGQKGLISKDFSVSSEYSNKIYEIVAEIALRTKGAPIPVLALAQEIAPAFAAHELHEVQHDAVFQLLDFIYSSAPLSTAYYSGYIPEFIKHRRQERAKAAYQGNNDRLTSELNKIIVSLGKDGIIPEGTSVSPFRELIKKSVTDLVETGFHALDTQMFGLGYGEYGIILGYSGGGKTAFGTSLCSNAALNGYNATYISLEEGTADIANRFYSRIYRISYTNLHNASAYLELDQVFLEQRQQAGMVRLAEHLTIEGMKEHAPMTTDAIYEALVRKYEQTGFIPDVVVIDQLQFLVPCITVESKPWEREKTVSKEVDAFSHRTIGGKHFACWALHQAKGKNKKQFNSEEIDGFKGIIQPADTVIGIGRDGPMSTEFNIFSLKSRHSKNFELTLHGDLEFMEFREQGVTMTPVDNRIQDSNPVQGSMRDAPYSPQPTRNPIL